MTAQSVMLANAVTVPESTTLAQAIEILFRHHIKSAPVVDAGGKYLGLFGMQTLVRQVLPRAARLDRGASLTDLAFVHDTIDSVKERLAGRLGESVMHFVDRDATRVAPTDSLLETLLLLHRDRHALPVVDPASDRLLGVVTDWAIIAKLTGRSA